MPISCGLGCEKRIPLASATTMNAAPDASRKCSAIGSMIAGGSGVENASTTSASVATTRARASARSPACSSSSLRAWRNDTTAPIPTVMRISPSTSTVIWVDSRRGSRTRGMDTPAG